MNISNALSNAVSGLAASGRLADTISNNVSNAMTPGFGRRTTELSSLALDGYGSGVRVSGTRRTENPYLTAERRIMDAALGAIATRSDAYGRMMGAIGEPGSAGALPTIATRLETTLMSAAASPHSSAKLADAVSAARELAGALNHVARENTRLRTEADGGIARQVEAVNEQLHGIRDLNQKIAAMSLQGSDVTGLQDERGRLIDQISDVIPLRAVRRDNEQIALYSQNGGVLLDGRVWELKFEASANAVTPGQTLGSGDLGALMQDQGAAGGPVVIEAGSGGGLMDGGSLAALFELRDRIVPEFDHEMDLYANDLIERFQALVPPGALDASGKGLFIDAGPGPLDGLAGRIALNAAVDPAQPGGEAWRLRDGLAAAAPGPQGNSGILQALGDAMTAARVPGGFVSQSAATGSATMASEIASFYAGKTARADDDRAFHAARQSVLEEQETHATGVDTDAELQSLMLVEQAYAANARVLSVVDDLMNMLLEV